MDAVREVNSKQRKAGAVRWYWLSCEQCGWKANQPVDEGVKNKFVEILEVCQECRKQGRPNRRFTVREFSTNTLPTGEKIE